MRSSLLTGLALCAGFMLFSPSPATAAEDTLNAFPLNGFYADVRYRFEHVEQDGIANHADASTIRAKVGYITNPVYDFTAGVEFELIGEMGDEDYNNSVNGKTTYPVVADPNGEELNHLWISYAGLPGTVIKAGRQPINLDNQRFIGTVGWRQNDQSFDGVTVTNKSLPKTELFYSYVNNVNRIFGDDHPQGDLETKNHLAHAKYNFADWLAVTGYGYWLDFDDSVTLSSKTYGLRLTGDTPINEDWKFFYTAEIAEQSDHADNTANYDASYYHLSPGVKWQNLTLQAGYESLEGDGTSAFQTPLATLHAHNGWADKFLSTPANGLEDLYGKVVYKFDGIAPVINGTKLVGVYHKFDAENGGADYGDEWDLQLSHALPAPDFTDSASIALKYADYNADTFGTDTEKLWLTVQVKF